MWAVQTELFSAVVHNCFSSVATDPIRSAKENGKVWLYFVPVSRTSQNFKELGCIL